MNIAICDDMENELEDIVGAVTEYAEAHPELFIKISSFSSPLDMLDDMNRNGVPDIALLDICMPGILGTEIANEIRTASGDNTDIIFLTTSSDFAVEAFALHANDYITKPYTQERLAETLDRAAERREKHLFVPITSGREVHRVDLYRVLYAEARNHGVEIHLKSGMTLDTRMTLTDIKKLFSKADGFIAVGASYIVNLRCVQSILQNDLLMINGKSVPVPRRLRNEVREQYFEFYRREAIKK